MKSLFKKNNVIVFFFAVCFVAGLSSCRGAFGKKAIKKAEECIGRLCKSAKKTSKVVFNCSDDVARRMDLQKVECEECGGDGTTWYFSECENCSGRGYNYEFKFE